MREVDADLRALADGAFQLQTGVMILRGVLDDGQAEPRAADGLGMAFIHAVEALENAALVRVGDAYAGVGDGEDGLGGALSDIDADAAAVYVVFDGVIA